MKGLQKLRNNRFRAHLQRYEPYNDPLSLLDLQDAASLAKGDRHV